MSLYTTPLQFGYFFSLLLWIIFMVRGVRAARLSDKLLGWIMFILAMELQDYTFGFAGINVLWNELNGFPRGVSLLFGPLVYFYFRAQTHTQFRLQKHHLWHFLPYTLAFLYEFSAFIQGPEAVQIQQASTLTLVLSYANRILMIASYTYYLSRCMIIYKAYRDWCLHEFSNADVISFRWFRNFIYAMIFWLLFREVMNILDAIFNLAFYQDWWWNLALVAVTFYIGLTGYAQNQPANIQFDIAAEPSLSHPEDLEKNNDDLQKIAKQLTRLMEEERLFIQPDLTLQGLAQQLQVNPHQLSAAINQIFAKNFNEYVNTYRIEAFIQLHTTDHAKKFTLLSMALDSGFNSKATFNRAFKKLKGVTPQVYLS